ncbi:MAG: asparagine synthase-related protein, partial [bacterium]|nr:asparagine synthase-related protein [bacterium]
KAILEYSGIKKKPNDKIVWDYLVSGLIDHNEETFFEGIKELRAGNYLKIAFRHACCKLKIDRYWKLPKDELSISDEEAADEFKRLFIDSVRLRLRSDVPVGTCLSGGLDSSAIAGVINELLKKEGKIEQIGKWQKTFSACYKNKEYKSFDEKFYIDKVVRKTKAQPFFTYPAPADFSKDLEKIIYHHDAPFLTVSVFAQWSVFKLAKSKKMKVMLDGQGSDEVLAGYFTFFPVLFNSLRKEKKYGLLFKETYYFLKLHYRQAFIKSAKNFFKFPLLKSIARGRLPRLKEIYQGSYLDLSVFSPEYQRHKPWKSEKPKTIKDQTRNLLSGKGLPALLRYEDRNSMAFSIESRTPFLDYRLVEFIYRLNDDKKIKSGQTKYLMRNALRGILPEEIRNRQDKIGFETPEEIWFRKELSGEIRKTFTSKSFVKRKYFNAENVIESFDRYIKGDPVSYQLFWRIYNLELWLRQYFG